MDFWIQDKRVRICVKKSRKQGNENQADKPAHVVSMRSVEENTLSSRVYRTA
jgi:hypothetical protein